MARLFPQDIEQFPQGELIIEESSPNSIKVYFVPPKESLNQSRLVQINPEYSQTQLLEVNELEDTITIYPINTRGDHVHFLMQKYNILESITLEGFKCTVPKDSDEVVDLLENLPKAFVQDFNFGLGLLKEYRFLIDFIEEHNLKHLVISKKQESHIDHSNRTCIISNGAFEQVRKSLDKITRDARSISSQVKRVAVNNVVSFFLKDGNFPLKPLNLKDTALATLIGRSSPSIPVNLSKDEQKEVISLVAKNYKTIVKEQPGALLKLHNEIELVTLEELITNYQSMLGKKLPESHWQKLFNDNPFILNLVFGYPVMKVQDQAYVGGATISGGGGKIADFLVKNGISNNAALFEIKTPSEELLYKSSYRGGVYTPSASLSGALNQILDQKHKFEKEINNIKVNSKLYDLETYAVHGVLIIGMMPTEEEQKKSFELFRGNSKNISIITFDELLEKLKQLQAFLSPNGEEKL